MGVLDGKVAIVTGGTSGIGEKIVEAFVGEGAKVVVGARRRDEGEKLEKRLGVRFIGADVSSEPDVKAMIDHAMKSFGRVDCLVNNAGVPSPMVSIAEIDVATIDQLLAINVRGVLLGIKHVAPVMLAQKSGRRPVNRAANQPMMTRMAAKVPSAHSTTTCGITRISRNATVIQRCFAGGATDSSVSPEGRENRLRAR